jgi:hypothetical protein
MKMAPETLVPSSKNRQVKSTEASIRMMSVVPRTESSKNLPRTSSTESQSCRESVNMPAASSKGCNSKSVSTAKVTPLETSNSQATRTVFREDSPDDKKHKSMLLQIGASFQNKGVADVAELLKVVDADARWVLDAQHPFRKFWTPFIMLLVLYSAIMVPFSIAFQPEALESTLIFDYLVDVLFVVDVLVNSRSSFVEDGMYV